MNFSHTHYHAQLCDIAAAPHATPRLKSDRGHENLQKCICHGGPLLCIDLHVVLPSFASSACFAARLNLPIKWLPDRIAEQNFNLEEPPTKASAWVGALLNNHLKVFRERLSTMPMLSPSDVDQARGPSSAQ